VQCVHDAGAGRERIASVGFGVETVGQCAEVAEFISRDLVLADSRPHRGKEIDHLATDLCGVAEQQLVSQHGRRQTRRLETAIKKKFGVCMGAAARQRVVNQRSHFSAERQMRRLGQRVRQTHFLEGENAARAYERVQPFQCGDWVGHKRQNESANRGVERPYRRQISHVGLKEPDVLEPCGLRSLAGVAQH
jgi:hypothetical protein